MGLLLEQIEWGEPILPTVVDPAWEAETKRRAEVLSSGLICQYQPEWVSSKSGS